MHTNKKATKSYRLQLVRNVNVMQARQRVRERSIRTSLWTAEVHLRKWKHAQTVQTCSCIKWSDVRKYFLELSNQHSSLRACSCAPTWSESASAPKSLLPPGIPWWCCCCCWWWLRWCCCWWWCCWWWWCCDWWWCDGMWGFCALLNRDFRLPELFLLLLSCCGIMPTPPDCWATAAAIPPSIGWCSWLLSAVDEQPKNWKPGPPTFWCIGWCGCCCCCWWRWCCCRPRSL